MNYVPFNLHEYGTYHFTHLLLSSGLFTLWSESRCFCCLFFQFLAVNAFYLKYSLCLGQMSTQLLLDEVCRYRLYIVILCCCVHVLLYSFDLFLQFFSFYFWNKFINLWLKLWIHMCTQRGVPSIVSMYVMMLFWGMHIKIY